MIGSHLMERLTALGDEVVGTRHNAIIDTRELERLERIARIVQLDVRYSDPVLRVIEQMKPDWIFHLAAQSYPTVSWERPQETFDTNVLGTLNVFEAIKRVRRSDPSYSPRVVVACSSAEYGASLTPENVPIREDAPLLPLHPYGVSKVAQDLLTFQYFVNDGLAGLRARIFNTTGPRKKDDVVSDFARRVAHLKMSGERRLKVGNLETRRAILDVRDTVAALVSLADRGHAGDVYNISGETPYRVGELVPMFAKAARVDLATETDPALLRPSDEAVIFGSTAKLKQHTGWSQTHPIEATITSVLDYELARIST